MQQDHDKLGYYRIQEILHGVPEELGRACQNQHDQSKIVCFSETWDDAVKTSKAMMRFQLAWVELELKDLG